MPLLTVKNLRAFYRTEVYGISRTVRAVDDVSFALSPNEIYGVAGESSCGANRTRIRVTSPGFMRNVSFQPRSFASAGRGLPCR